MAEIKYDVVIVGAGPCGYMCAYEYNKLNPSAKILLIDKGRDINTRNCPVLNHKLEKCPVVKKGFPGCLPSCSITCGFGGAGAYSDGKFNISSEYGGWLNEYMDDETLLELIKYCDEINVLFGASSELTNPYTSQVKEIERLAVGAGLKLLRSNIRHLGTEQNLQILKRYYEHLKSRIDIRFGTTVTDIIVKKNQVCGVIINNKDKINANYVVFAPGRDGSILLEEIMEKHNVEMHNNQVDIGVRVETSNIIMEDINKNLYEGKLVLNTSVGTKVRTFCSNPSGHVVVENDHNVILANGHAYHDPKFGSSNTNFALLVSTVFKEPFNQPNEFAHSISSLANKLSCGTVIVQKYGDIKKGRRSTEKRIKEGWIRPTLKEAVPGDLTLCLPYKTMKSIIEMIEALNKVTPGIANDDTLLYGVEAKFYSAHPEINNKLMVKGIKNLYVGGDGAGITRGLAQAAACGVYIARNINKGEK